MPKMAKHLLQCDDERKAYLRNKEFWEEHLSQLRRRPEAASDLIEWAAEHIEGLEARIRWLEVYMEKIGRQRHA